MSNALKKKVHELRKLHCNPYAYIEYLDEFCQDEAAVLAPAEVDAPLESIKASKKLLQDPYAHHDGDGKLSALRNDAPHAKPKRSPRPTNAGTSTTQRPRGQGTANLLREYTDQEIEGRARELLIALWKNRQSLWDGASASPISVIDPVVALRYLGYDCVLDDALGRYNNEGKTIEVAGLIDRAAKLVQISPQFPAHVRAFTAAHELGHALLHPDSGGVHRDRPIDGSSRSREQTELEADKFAACFLMPSRLVRELFAERFSSAPFILTDQTAYNLLHEPVERARQALPIRRAVARRLASAESYGGRFFTSLAAQLNVSVEAMAIRLEELGLIGE